MLIPGWVLQNCTINTSKAKVIIMNKKIAAESTNTAVPAIPDNFIAEDFLTFMLSKEGSIPTAETERISKEIISIVANGLCGAVIAGEPRIGKTRMIKIVEDKLHKKFGEDLPVYSWICSERSAKTDKAFYTEMLHVLKFPDPKKRDTALDMKLRLINAIKIDAERTKMKKVVLFIDEAQRLEQRDFNWLITLYNELDAGDSRLIVFLVGQYHDMHVLLTKLRRERQNQIIGRFFTRFFDFYGIVDEKSLAFLLLSIDKNMNYKYGKGSIMISRDLFPFSYDDKAGLMNLNAPIWEAFTVISEKHNKKTAQIPMEYMMVTIKDIIRHYSIIGDGPEGSLGVFPGVSEISKCIEDSGYQYYADAFTEDEEKEKDYA